VDFQLLYTPSALKDLEEILTWSWEQHPEKTDRFGRALLNHIELLKGFPRLGAPLSGFPGVRRLFHSPLHIYYRVLDHQNRIEVLNVRHVSRRAPQF
jgi:plasmid stabilization system protein ParE